MAEELTVNRTTITLYRAMFSLLSTTPFDDITVNDICQKAMVSRSTFYSYFQDKYQLVIFCLEQERDQLDIIKGENVKENILKMLKQIEAKKEIYINIFLAQTNRELNRMFVQHTQGFIRFGLQKIISLEEELEVLTVLYSTGYAGTIMWWLETGFTVSAENLADYLYYAFTLIVDSLKK